jgi:hypothetical protein
VAFSERIYSDAQRAACVAAFALPGVSAKDVSAMAAAGELSDHDGERLPAFKVPDNTVRDIARKARRRGEQPSPLVAVPPRDAVEQLRQRLVTLADCEVTALEKQREGKRDLNRMFEAARVVREASRIPGPRDPLPKAPASVPAPATGAAGALLADHRATPEPIRTPPAPVPVPAPEVSTQEESVEERLQRQCRETIDRYRPQEEPRGDQRRLVEQSLTADHREADESRGRRRRRVDEDTSSWRGAR